MITDTTRRLFLQRASLGAAGIVFGTRRTLAQARLAAGLPYTAAEIAQRLGISMAVDHSLRYRHVTLRGRPQLPPAKAK